MNQTNSPPTTAQIIERIKQELTTEALDDHLPELLEAGTEAQDLAFGGFKETTKDIAEITTFDSLMEHLIGYGYSAMLAAQLVVEAYRLETHLSYSLQRLLSQIPDKGWDA